MKHPHLLPSLASLIAFALLAPLPFSIADAAAPPAPPARTKLPDQHPHQKTLRQFLGSLTEKDFDHGIKEPVAAAHVSDADDHYRAWLLSLEFPRIGRKRSAPSINLPAQQFTLAAIENPEKGIMRPSCWPEPTAWFANWDYPGNPYLGSRALKLRAFATATVLLLMTDDLQENSGSPKDTRSDWLGPHLINYAYTYNNVRDALPADTRAAYETCLLRMMHRVTKWGPKGDETHFDLSAVLGMRLAADAIKTPEAKTLAETYARRVFSDPWYYHPAGYFTDQGCVDAGYQGMSLYFATWLALAAPDWPFVQDAVKKVWRLRSHLALPEPDGTVVGPSHFNARTSSDVFKDQWDFPFRIVAASLLTDDVACEVRSPTAEQLKAAPTAAAAEARAEIHENPGGLTNDKLASHPWRWSLWPNAPAFPMNNYAYDYYRKGHLAHRQELERTNSPLLKYPFARGNLFTDTYEKAFLISRKPKFGVIVHTGPVSEFQGEGHIEFAGPYGLSGGSLSAFWTPDAGTVLLGRRGGMPFPNQTPPNFDTPELWRAWPVHAVTGSTAAGKVFTSARIQKPDVIYESQGATFRAKASGIIPAITMGKEKSLEGNISYSRTFTLSDNSLRIETTLNSDGKDKIAELYEVLPVFLRDLERQPKAIPTKIEFQTGGQWTAATDQFTTTVQAVRLTRFTGAVEIRFTRPCRAKLSPAEWTDKYLSRASCRNVLIDLLDATPAPGPFQGERTLAYEIFAAAK